MFEWSEEKGEERGREGKKGEEGKREHAEK